MYLPDCVSTPVSGVPLGLRLDDADGLAVGVQQVVGVAGLEREFANGHAQARRDVHLAVVLDGPAGLLKLPVDLLAGFLFWGHAPPSVGNAGAA